MDIRTLAAMSTIAVLIMLCSGSVASATAINNDYFYASSVSDKDDELQRHALLLNVDKNHMDPAMAAISQRDFKNALAHLDYTLVRFPNHPRALTLLGAVAKLTNTPTLAIPYYEHALRLYPQYAFTHAQYGHYLSEISRREEGILKLKAAIELDAKLAVAYAWLSEAYSKSGRPELAQEAGEQARQLGYQARQPLTSR